MKVKIEASGDEFYAHKVVLFSNSDLFENELKDNVFTFPKDCDESAAKNLLKFFYSGSLEYKDDVSVTTFMILANKYKVKHLNEFKVPAKVYLNGVISYIEKDLSNRVGEFDNLAESVDFKKMEKDDLTKLYAKKKWLQKSSTFLNQIILKDMEDSDDKESGSEKEDEEEEGDEDDEDNPFSGSKLIKGSWGSTLNKWTKHKKGWKMIFRATKDGFSASSFRSKCSQKGPTIVVIKSSNGNIFGGYNANPWNTSGSYTISMENFLFSFKRAGDKKKKPVQCKSNSSNNSYSAYDGSNYGPTFGGGHDLYLCDNCNSTASSYSNLGYTYLCDGVTYGQQNAKDFLAGAYNFTVAEYEVWAKKGK